ncbi:hypothetical protein LEP1GSC128_0746 [Leptospira borgpetersenii str. 200801926]|uniref:Uncharacterized protein n=2 Tax=Leptospira borgpetersenii TaxID=174 RepID=M3HQ58_LEPBO|nr:hypothetical protein LEP1GSC128_0746 [Leptospira borgpetersenii str. 200801926]EMF99799.1 hypothetical protein LEP1GSC123_3534 [Leptospira borgpetersenii str. 200701203]EMK09128.1 hypothetical protein LEP1GSC066_0221 [Leptospira sp. serovar Kenya str. Sh9]
MLNKYFTPLFILSIFVHLVNTYFFWGTPGIIYTKLIPLSLCILYVSISWGTGVFPY